MHAAHGRSTAACSCWYYSMQWHGSNELRLEWCHEVPEYSVPVPAFRTLGQGVPADWAFGPYHVVLPVLPAHGSAWGVPILVTLLGHESAWLGMAWHAWRGCMAWLHAECGFHGLACSLYWFRFREPAEDRSNGAISAERTNICPKPSAPKPPANRESTPCGRAAGAM